KRMMCVWVALPGYLGISLALSFCLHLLSLPYSRSEEKVTVYFINRDGQKITTSGAKGNSLLDLVVDQNVSIDGFGACEGTLACSTCHVILDQKVYDQLGPIIDEENDMLDLAFGLTDTPHRQMSDTLADAYTSHTIYSLRNTQNTYSMNMLSLAHGLTST
uniref:Ferredoxin 1 n=1 Tax=Hucho hucho TaxID=62062 RepID=A0A4W5KDE0_9TELE